MRYTLLEMTQQILSAMDSDEVDSISDTVESTQVANLLKQVFYDIATDIRLPTHEAIFELNASGDNTKPCIMYIPSNVCRIDWIKYDNKLSTDTNSDYVEVKNMGFVDFLARQRGLREQASGVVEQTFVSNGENHNIMCRSDQMPMFYTDVGNYTLIFDSYDNTQDTTLQKSKTMCGGVIYPTWSATDNFTPDLDPYYFSYFLNKAKARAFVELKQSDNPEARSEARRQKIVLQKRKERVQQEAPIYKSVRYGRK